jgi:hypothetical protein
MSPKLREQLWKQFREENGPLPGGRGFQEVYQAKWARYVEDHRNDTIVGEDGRKFIDMTPSWAGVLGTWRHVVESCMGEKPTNLNPEASMSEFWKEMARMAESADKWNDYAIKTIPVEETPDASE